MVGRTFADAVQIESLPPSLQAAFGRAGGASAADTVKPSRKNDILHVKMILAQSDEAGVLCRGVMGDMGSFPTRSPRSRVQ
jgi:hypothetical protein